MRASRWLPAAAALLALPGPVRADTHVDEKLGFAVQVPKGWLRTALPGSEQWIVAKYRCDREYVGKKEAFSHTPEMNVVLIPREAAKAPEAKVDEAAGKVTVSIRKAFKDYKAWLADYGESQGGFYISSETETTVNGVPTTCYEVKFEKLTIPRHLVAWVFHAGDADYAVQLDALEDYWDRLSKEYLVCLKTFRLLPRKGSLPTATGQGEIEIDLPGKKRTPEEEAKNRETKFQVALRKAVDGLPAGWSQKKSKNYVAVSHVDDKYTQKVLDQAEGLRAWFEANLAWIGEWKAGPMIIRICADANERRSFNSGVGISAWLGSGFEILTSKEVSQGRSFAEFAGLNGDLTRAWLREKNRDVSYAMPGWLRLGLYGFVANGVVKGGRIDFRLDEVDTKRLRDARKSGKLATVQELLRADSGALQKLEDPSVQAASLVRYLLDGPGGKVPRTKDSFPTYVNALVAFVREREAKEAADSGKPASAEPATEEEEDAQFKKRQTQWKEREKELLDAVYGSTFGAWTDQDWKAVEASYRQFTD